MVKISDQIHLGICRPIGHSLLVMIELRVVKTRDFAS